VFVLLKNKNLKNLDFARYIIKKKAPVLQLMLLDMSEKNIIFLSFTGAFAAFCCFLSCFSCTKPSLD
jgi:hypothetical protein